MIMKLPTEPRTRGHYGDDADIEKVIETFANWAENRVRQVQRYAASRRGRAGTNALVERVYQLLTPKYVRPTHDLLCECRKCTPSHRKFILAIEEGKRWC